MHSSCYKSMETPFPRVPTALHHWVNPVCRNKVNKPESCCKEAKSMQIPLVPCLRFKNVKCVVRHHLSLHNFVIHRLFTIGCSIYKNWAGNYKNWACVLFHHILIQYVNFMVLSNTNVEGEILNSNPTKFGIFSNQVNGLRIKSYLKR